MLTWSYHFRRTDVVIDVTVPGQRVGGKVTVPPYLLIGTFAFLEVFDVPVALF